MIVKELIEILNKCNLEAKVIIDNERDELSLSWSGSGNDGEHCTLENCKTICINKSYELKN